MKKYLLLQSRPETVASDNEYEAFVELGGLSPDQVERVRLDAGDFPQINLNDYAAVIMGGGPANFAYSEDQKSPVQRRFEPYLFDLLAEIIANDKPFLGTCLGYGAVVKALGGDVSFDFGEPVEAARVRLTSSGHDDRLLAGLPKEFDAFVGHKEGVKELPSRAIELARSKTCSQMLRVGSNVYATQFHPELNGPGLALRIETYKDAGYFPPEEANQLINMALESVVDQPVQILRRFIEIYS